MTLVPATLDYTDLDQESLEKRIYRMVDAVLPDWTIRRRANIGNTLVGAFANVGDLLSFLQDNNANEAFVGTARLRQSLLAHAKKYGYRPETAGAAKASLVFVLDAVAAGSVTVPKGKRVLTAEVTAPVAFQLLADAVIPAGQVTVTVDAEHSESRTDIVVSTEAPNAAIRLRGSPFIDDTLDLVAGNGAYTVVADLLSSRSTDRHCTVTVDDLDRATVRFGNGASGAIPTGTITASYKTGGGPNGNLEPGRLTRLEGSYRDSLGNPVRISVTNPAETSGGAPRESSAAIRRNLPRSMRVLERAVAREDYEIVAESVPGVARALHMTGNQLPSIGENQGLLLIVPDGLGIATQTLLEDVKSRFETVAGRAAPTHKKTNTYQLVYAQAPYQVIDWLAVVDLAPNVTRVAGRASIEAAVRTFHALEVEGESGELERNALIQFGYYASNALGWSDAFNVVRDATGVAAVDPGSAGFLLNGIRDDVELLPQHFPKLGTITLIDRRTGEIF
jgi:hypothetical protein